MTIGEIIHVAPTSEDVFRKHGLDPNSVHQMEFEDACAKCAVDAHLVKGELINIRTTEKKLTESMKQAIENILNHHQIVKRILSDIGATLAIAIAVEETSRYELLSIKTKFEMLQEQLELHLYKEEMVLFPEFMGLFDKRDGHPHAPSFPLAYPIERLESEHETVKTILSEIRQLSGYHQIPKNTGESYQNVYRHLHALEKRMDDLIRLENTMLFPEALALENKFYNDDSK